MKHNNIALLLLSLAPSCTRNAEVEDSNVFRFYNPPHESECRASSCVITNYSLISREPYQQSSENPLRVSIDGSPYREIDFASFSDARIGKDHTFLLTDQPVFFSPAMPSGEHTVRAIREIGKKKYRATTTFTVY